MGIKELKNHLSAYLREVKLGTRIFLTDRNEVVAELRKPDFGSLHPAPSSLLEQWVREGKVIPASGEKPHLPPSPVRLPDGTAQKLLDEVRGD